MNSENTRTNSFWDSFIRAVEAEPSGETEYIRGASGVRHRVAALGLDKSRRRLILVAGDMDAHAAAFAQADLQSAYKAVQVIVARPSAMKVHDQMFEESRKKAVRSGEEGTASHESFTDASLEDRKAGLCYISLEDYSNDEIELICGAADIEAVRETFRRHNLLQYFFPAPDQLALGLIESGRVRYLHQLIDQLVRTPDAGHPFGPAELVKAFYSFTEMVKELQNLGLVSDGERGLELTDAGLQVRETVRDAPREALVYKILNSLEANLYLKSLLLPKMVPASLSEEEG